LAATEWQAKERKTHPAVIRMNGKAQTRKFRQVDIRDIRQKAKTMSIADLAREYDIAYNSMYAIVKGISYRSLNLIYPPLW
jgi:nucleotidyltransferase/DNA polymerase involved in DNA repair